MNKKKRIYWVWSLMWVVFIYSTLSIMRPICDYLRDNTPFSVLTNTMVLFTLIVSAIIIYVRHGIHKISTFFMLLVLFLIYFFILENLNIASERIHFIQYGILVYLLFRAFRADCHLIKSQIGAFILTSLFGLGDEGIQNLLPTRYFDWSDVWLNMLSAFLGLCWINVFIYDKK